MKKFLLIPLIAIWLGGCDLQTIETGITLTTKSITNPVTKTEEAQVELALHAAIDTLNAYKAACIKGVADVHCRANIAQIQAYTRQMPTLIIQLRNFVDNNDQINASVVYNQLIAIYTNVKNFSATAGVNLGGLS